MRQATAFWLALLALLMAASTASGSGEAVVPWRVVGVGQNFQVSYLPEPSSPSLHFSGAPVFDQSVWTGTWYVRAWHVTVLSSRAAVIAQQRLENSVNHLSLDPLVVAKALAHTNFAFRRLLLVETQTADFCCVFSVEGIGSAGAHASMTIRPISKCSPTTSNTNPPVASTCAYPEAPLVEYAFVSVSRSDFHLPSSFTLAFDQTPIFPPSP
jgi:hypothetical protein